ncbi:MAG: tetratricopeptide repeat protein [Verrucomicrobiota bacterium]
MKTLSRYLLLCTLPLSVAMAQEETPSTNAPVSSLGLSVQQSQEKRIEFLLEVAQAYAAEENYSAAVDAYERILEIDPEHLQTRYVVAHIYISAKQYKKAETFLLQLIEEYPQDFKIWNNIAWLYATAEDPTVRNSQKAIKCAHEAMVLAPNDHHVWSTLAEAYYVAGEYEKAQRAIRHMTSLAIRYGTGITKESVESYNEQIKKCQRAMDTAEALKKTDQ